MEIRCALFFGGGIVRCGVLSSKLTIVRPGHAEAAVFLKFWRPRNRFSRGRTRRRRLSVLEDDLVVACFQGIIGQPSAGDPEVLKQRPSGTARFGSRLAEAAVFLKLGGPGTDPVGVVHSVVSHVFPNSQWKITS